MPVMLYSEQKQEASDQEHEAHGNPDALAPSGVRDRADGERRRERRDLSGEREEAEELGDFVGRAHARKQRAARGLDRPRGDADQHGEDEIDLLAYRRER